MFAVRICCCLAVLTIVCGVSDTEAARSKNRSWRWTNAYNARVPLALKALKKQFGDEALAPNTLQKNKDPAATAIISQAIGRAGTTGSALYAQIRRIEKGDYDAGLRRAGLEPRKFRRSTKPTKAHRQRVLDAIKTIDQAIGPQALSSDHLQQDRTDEKAKLLEPIFGRSDITGRRLYGYIRRLYPTADGHQRAMKDAGLDAAKVVRRKNWSAAEDGQIPRALQAIALSLGQERLTPGRLHQDRTAEMATIVRRIIPRPEINGEKLYARIGRVYQGKGGYDAALADAHIDVSEVKEQQVWSAEQLERIPLAVAKLSERLGKEAVSSQSMQDDRSKGTSDIVRPIIGRKNVNGQNLHSAAVRHWRGRGGFDQVLRLAGLNPVDVRRKTQWTHKQRQSIPKLLQRMHDQFGPEALNSDSMKANDSDALQQIGEQVLGRRGVTGSRLYGQARKTFREEGGYYGALSNAGLDVDAICREGLGGSGTRSCYAGETFSSKLERDTAIILQQCDVIDGLRRGVDREIRVDGMRLDFYSPRFKTVFEPHAFFDDALPNIRAYQSHRRKRLSSQPAPYDTARCFAFSNTSQLLNDVLPQLAIRPTSDLREQIRATIKHAEAQTN